jgi:FPC/CPF motif-containing protein YcgG
MQGSGTAKNLAFGLFEYLIAMSGSPSDFLTYIAVFPESGFGDEPEFEAALWELLNRLHSEDRKHFEWCPEYAKDPATNDFSFCFGGQGFFIVGLHPHSSRKARRFRYPAIAFNLQSQFEALRKKGRFDTMRKAIREREIEFQGAINPMLADLGEGMQAPQYSGRKVDEDWTCPFSVQE